MGYSPWAPEQSDTIERLTFHFHCSPSTPCSSRERVSSQSGSVLLVSRPSLPPLPSATLDYCRQCHCFLKGIADSSPRGGAGSLIAHSL